MSKKNISEYLKDPRPNNPLLQSEVLRIVHQKKKGFSLQDIAEKLHISEKISKKVVLYLTHHGGYNIIPQGDDHYKLVKELPPMKSLNLRRLLGKEYYFGVVSDTHLCNRFARLDVLEAAYDVYSKRGIVDVFHAGNILDGECKFNMYEIVVHGVHDQCQFVADHYPQRNGITTYFITGECHEGWYQKTNGLRIGWYIQNWCKECGRKDLVHIGHVEQDVIIERPHGETRIKIMHPGGGTAYATSYSAQKMVESFQGGEKPNMLILGHYHKFDFSYPREIPTLQAGCVQDQTIFERKKKLQAHVGFSIVKISSRVDGTLGSMQVEWFPFYDQKYHRRLNEFKLKKSSKIS